MLNPKTFHSSISGSQNYELLGDPSVLATFFLALLAFLLFFTAGSTVPSALPCDPPAVISAHFSNGLSRIQGMKAGDAEKDQQDNCAVAYVKQKIMIDVLEWGQGFRNILYLVCMLRLTNFD